MRAEKCKTTVWAEIKCKTTVSVFGDYKGARERKQGNKVLENYNLIYGHKITTNYNIITT
jgi:hypothetical protein